VPEVQTDEVGDEFDLITERKFRTAALPLVEHDGNFDDTGSVPNQFGKK
jgi:hypothetical protein